jgi:hypothetical protein
MNAASELWKSKQIGAWMHQKWSSSSTGDVSRSDWSGSRYAVLGPSRSRTHTADMVLDCVCSIAASLAIDPVNDRKILFEQYDFKLWSQKDRLLIFCLSVTPSLFGMAVVFAAFKGISKLRSNL